MNARVIAEFGMEGGGQGFAFTYHDSVVAFGSNDVHAFTDAFDLGRANEDHLKRMVAKLSFANRAVHLASISVAADGDVESGQSLLLRVFHFGSQQNSARTGTEGRLGMDEIL